MIRSKRAVVLSVFLLWTILRVKLFRYVGENRDEIATISFLLFIEGAVLAVALMTRATLIESTEERKEPVLFGLGKLFLFFAPVSIALLIAILFGVFSEYQHGFHQTRFWYGLTVAVVTSLLENARQYMVDYYAILVSAAIFDLWVRATRAFFGED